MRYQFETGLVLNFHRYHSFQYNLYGYVSTADTFYSYYYDEDRFYRIARITLPVKLLYHLHPRPFPLYVTAGMSVSRMLFDAITGDPPEITEEHIKTDTYGNSITYYRYQLDYIAGIGKFVRLGPTLQMRLEGGYSGSAVSVLKMPDRGWLSAIYLQLGLISL